MTVEQAREACTKKGGVLTVIYRTEITRSEVKPPIESPGDCISTEKFGVPSSAPAGAPPAS